MSTLKNDTKKVLGGSIEFRVAAIKDMGYEKFCKSYKGKFSTPLKETYEAITGEKVKLSDYKKPEKKEIKETSEKKSKGKK